jgi:hypothetical protein
VAPRARAHGLAPAISHHFPRGQAAGHPTVSQHQRVISGDDKIPAGFAVKSVYWIKAQAQRRRVSPDSGALIPT